jgi:hypothetical protein
MIGVPITLIVVERGMYAKKSDHKKGTVQSFLPETVCEPLCVQTELQA